MAEKPISPLAADSKAGSLSPPLRVAGLRIAPLDVPLERRLQTAALLTTMSLMPGSILLVFALAFFPPFVALHSRVFLAAYLVWLWFDRKTPLRGGREWFWLRNIPLWRKAADYFPTKLEVIPPQGYHTEDGTPCIFCIHPHGVISMAAIFTLLLNAQEALKKVGVDYRVATVSFNMSFPLWRDLLLALGFVSASRSGIRYLLDTERKSVGIVIGGAEETLYSKPGSSDLVLAKRKGFCKLALKTGASLVPVFCFGETELYSQANSPFLRKLQMLAIRLLGFTIPLIKGRGIFIYNFGVLPQRRPLTTVMGDPLKVEKWIPPAGEREPPGELVDALHARYIDALKKMFDENKDKYSKPVDALGRPVEQQPLKIVA